MFSRLPTFLATLDEAIAADESSCDAVLALELYENARSQILTSEFAGLLSYLDFSSPIYRAMQALIL